ncbi:MAG: DNA polymerase III subunit gamma/tau [Bacteroidetes bacterium]|nr:MAG: DNA polymerase III subunit gamma/tau [Bacteroidota bacterium]
MEKFIVSARKYRPQTFDTVVGQSHITTTLKNAIRNNQLAHAFLFCGPRGVGKTTCARILAKTINCENIQPDGEACNKCTSCKTFNEGTSLNIHELDAASNNSVDDIRTLTDQVRFAPQAGKYKVYIIDEVHMLSSSAFNAFLKTLEEPPPYAIFILATTEKHKILPTILSRCQIFDFKRITTNDTVEHLQEICKKEDIKADKAGLQVIAQKSEGCMRDALSIMDKIVSFTNGEITYSNTLEHLNILDADYYFKLIDAMTAQDLGAAMILYDDINRKGFEGDMVLNGFAEFIRNLLVCKDEKVIGLLEVVEGFEEKYSAASKKISSAFLISALNILNEAEINYKAARNKRLHVELALIRLTYLQQAIELVEDNSGIGKKKPSESARPVAFRNIVPLEIKSKESSEITSTTSGKMPFGLKEKPVPQEDGPRLIIQEKTIREPEKVSKAAAEVQTEKAPTLGALLKIRQQVQKNRLNGNDIAKSLNTENLQEAWNLYVDKLSRQKNHSSVTNFKLAQLRITDENSFEIITESNIQQKFIEQERGALIEHLQLFFNNRTLNYQITVLEAQSEKEPQDRPLTQKEQYLKMIEEYPLVKELKERLRLELDF